MELLQSEILPSCPSKITPLKRRSSLVTTYLEKDLTQRDHPSDLFVENLHKSSIEEIQDRLNDSQLEGSILVGADAVAATELIEANQGKYE